MSAQESATWARLVEALEVAIRVTSPGNPGQRALRNFQRALQAIVDGKEPEAIMPPGMRRDFLASSRSADAGSPAPVESLPPERYLVLEPESEPGAPRHLEEAPPEATDGRQPLPQTSRRGRPGVSVTIPS